MEHGPEHKELPEDEKLYQEELSIAQGVPVMPDYAEPGTSASRRRATPRRESLDYVQTE